MVRKCVVKATAWGKKNQILTKPITKKQAQKRVRDLKRDMRISIPKWRWAKNIRIEC